MFGRIASIHFALALLALVSASNAGVLCAPRTVVGAPVSPANYSNSDLHFSQSGPTGTAVHSHGADVPSAPLPPALWPGLSLLVVLGGVRIAMRTRRRGIH